MLHAGVCSHIFIWRLWAHLAKHKAGHDVAFPGASWHDIHGGVHPQGVQGRMRRAGQDEEAFLLQLQTRQISVEKCTGLFCMIKKPENRGWQLLHFLLFFFLIFIIIKLLLVTCNIFVRWQLQLLED